MSAIPDASVLELYPDEINKLKLITAAVSRKYTGQTATVERLTALATEIEGRCRDELNLDVICDPTTVQLAGDGKTTYLSPTVSPIQRLVPEVFDFARARYETQQGFVDGVPGTITEDGRWVEPTKPISMSGAVDVANG
ncbi:MAG TPA: hypothetical protein VIY48_15085 [Candidatus Paceibacterota bacterium]